MRSFVGRDAERALFRSALQHDEAGFSVLYVHGPGGAGKTTLLRVLADDARAAGRSVVEVDFRVTGATSHAFEDECGCALTTDGVVLLIDTFEQSQALAAWLRTRFLPRLPIDALVVIAGRLPLDPDWRADPDWNDALRVIALSDLDTVEAVALLAARGVPEEQYPSLLAFAGGQPLALTLAADLATQREFAPEDWRPNQEIVKTLLHSLVGSVPTLTHRQALEVCAHVEVTTEELLRSALGDNAADLFEWLRGLPFIECGRYGVYPHDVVRDVLTQDLRWRDPEGYGLLHRNIHDHLLGDVRAAAGSDVIEKTRSLLYLYRHASSVANYLTWTGRGEVYEADYLPQDRAAVLRLTSECEGAESARIAAFWLDRQPDAFHLQRRSETGEIVAFSAWLRLHGPEQDEIAADPVIAAAWRHCDTFGPTRPGEHIAVSRFTIDANAYGGTSPAVDLMIARVMAEWMRAHRIAWSFLVYLDIEAWDTQAKSVEHQPISDRVTVNGRELLLYGHDWRIAPLQLWLSQQETEVLSGRRPSAPAQRSCVVLPRPQFDTAVRAALRHIGHDAALEANPLCGNGLADTGPVLRKLLTEAVQMLADDPRAIKEYSAVYTTFFLPVPTQEAAAARLDLPFSTYRRHLARGTERICEYLWDRELNANRLPTA
jgi:AAA ATPase domain